MEQNPGSKPHLKSMAVCWVERDHASFSIPPSLQFLFQSLISNCSAVPESNLTTWSCISLGDIPPSCLLEGTEWFSGFQLWHCGFLLLQNKRRPPNIIKAEKDQNYCRTVLKYRGYKVSFFFLLTI